MLTDWRDGRRSPESVIGEARQLWLAGAAPEDDGIASDVLVMLATANDGFTHEDIPAFLEFLGTPQGSEQSGLDRFGDYVLGLDLDSRERTANSEYYGSAAGFELEQGFFLRDPDQRRLARAASEDPESVWPELVALFTTPAATSERELLASNLLEDLIFWHAETYIDRIEALAAASAVMRDRLAAAVVGGIAPSPALERFWKLQESIQRDAGATR